MNKTILSGLAALIALGAIIASIEEASAVVCARGVYRAGCAGPRGAVVSHGVVAPRRAVIVR